MKTTCFPVWRGKTTRHILSKTLNLLDLNVFIMLLLFQFNLKNVKKFHFSLKMIINSCSCHSYFSGEHWYQINCSYGRSILEISIRVLKCLGKSLRFAGRYLDCKNKEKALTLDSLLSFLHIHIIGCL